MLRLCCISHFCERHKKSKVVIVQSAPFGIAIDIRSGKGIAASSSKAYDFKLIAIINGTEVLEDRVDTSAFLKNVFPGLKCYSVGIQKTKNPEIFVKIFLSGNVEIQGRIYKS